MTDSRSEILRHLCHTLILSSRHLHSIHCHEFLLFFVCTFCIFEQDWLGADFVAAHPYAPPYRATGVILMVKVDYRNMDQLKPHIFEPTADLTVSYFPRIWGAMVRDYLSPKQLPSNS